MKMDVSSEIRELNLSYLMLSQQLIQADRAGAMFKLGIGEDVADIIQNLSPAQILRMASSDMLLCRFRFDDTLLLNLLGNHGRENAAARIHATILATTKPVEHLA
ncbi:MULTISPECIES: flagellar transcriptional regulator FlhD [unclassified Uliginosibacterium]|uniref:flagellar transcriptional regulator FlhD n=1 Tax=unclassified Uliginosibacterium TaxID=2621521 RepID=UPI000C7DDBC8|nr:MULTISPECIES: flagellar transcriptional regulator FlhD [unclassified Uliginosibacterium]MDO6384933.1 flagellar transcriptional regulator FlhD [Uliginosibacterium sp. 31-12]PLK48897.1 flagellar transcriptional regulator FlhD [Uliginosibacterium sp. TH139]